MKITAGKIKLSADERAAFFARDWPELAGSGKPPQLTERHYALSSRLSFTVRLIHRTRKGWRLEYDVIDDREERFMLLPSATSFPTDERGQPLEGLPPEEEIGYTRNPKRRTIDELPAVRPDVQNVIGMRSRLSDTQRRRLDDAEVEAERDLQRFQAELRELTKRAAKMGVDPLHAMAPVARAIREAQDALDEKAA